MTNFWTGFFSTVATFVAVCILGLILAPAPTAAGTVHYGHAKISLFNSHAMLDNTRVYGKVEP